MGGISSRLSLSALPPASRTVKSLKLAVGNAMHVAHIGAVLAVVLLRLPSLSDPEGLVPGHTSPQEKHVPISPLRTRKRLSRGDATTSPKDPKSARSAATSSSELVTAPPLEASSSAPAPSTALFSVAGPFDSFERCLQARYRSRVAVLSRK